MGDGDDGDESRGGGNCEGDEVGGGDEGDAVGGGEGKGGSWEGGGGAWRHDVARKVVVLGEDGAERHDDD